MQVYIAFERMKDNLFRLLAIWLLESFHSHRWLGLVGIWGRGLSKNFENDILPEY